MIKIDGFPTHVLVVDDRDRVRDSLRSRIALSSPSYVVETAASGADALERLGSGLFDVVLCDLKLRGEMDGIAVTRKIGERHPQVRVVVFSGQDAGQSKIDVLNAGAYSYLSKPINHDELLHAIRTINSIRRTERLSQSFQMLARISHALQARFDFEHRAEQIVDGALELGYTRARLYLFDADHQTLVGKVARGLDEDQLTGNSAFEGYKIPFSASPMISQIFAKDRPTLWNASLILQHFGEACAEPWLSDMALDGITWLDCPLLVGQRRIGSLAVDHRGRPTRRFTEEDRQIMGVFSGLAAQALHNSRLYEREALAKASLQSILLDAPDAVITTDLDGTIDAVSPSAERIIGYRPGDMIGHPASDFYTDDHGAADTGPIVVENLMRDLRQTKTITNRELYLRSPEGHPLPVSLSCSLLHNEAGEAIGTLAFVKDLSPLEAQSQQYRDVLEGFGYGTLLLSKRGIIGFVNRKAARMLGHSRTELLGRSFREMLLQAQQADFERGLLAVLDKGDEVRLDLSLIQHDAHRLPITATLTPVKTRRSLSGVAVALHDKSELGALIRSGRLMALGQMIAGIAHEINNPLNHILLASGELEEDLPTDDSDLRHCLTLIQRNSRRIRDLVKQLREFARPTEFERRAVSLDRILREAISFFASRFRHHNIAVIEDLAPNLPPILGDPVRLQQVIVNLIVNAEDAMDEQDEPKEVRITSYSLPNDRVGFSISDAGCGIPEAIKEAIFDPFFTTKSPNRGTGLGLSISKSIIDLHEGTIGVMDNPRGRGTTFTIELPQARHEA